MFQILQENAHGGTVKGNVMEIHQQVYGRLGGIDFKAVQVVVEQVKRLHEFRHDRLHFAFIPIQDQDLSRLFIPALLHDLALLQDQAGFQVPVGIHDFYQGFFQPGRIQGFGIPAANSHRYVVLQGFPGLFPVVINPFLGFRKRVKFLRGIRFKTLRGGRFPLAGQQTGQQPDGFEFQDVFGCQVDVQLLFDHHGKTDGQQRGQSYGQQIGGNSKFICLQDFCYDRKEVFFHDGLRRDDLFECQVRYGELFAVHFTVGRHGKGLQFEQRRGNHVVGQAGAQVFHQGVFGNGNIVVRLVIGTQLLCSPELLDIGNGRYDPREFGHYGFDFPKFYAESAQFDLGIYPAQVFQQAVAAPAYQVTGAVQFVINRPGSVGIGQETFCRDIFPQPVTQGDLGSCQAQFAGHPDR